MNAITDYFKQAELAFASYADLPSGAIDVTRLTAQEVGFARAHAESFIGRWDVVEQYNGQDGRIVNYIDEFGNPQQAQVSRLLKNSPRREEPSFPRRRESSK